MLTVRGCHLIPTGCGLVQYDHLAALFVLAQDAAIRARTGTQVQRPTLGRDLIDLHIVGAGLVLLGDQANAGRHGGGHRRSQDAALRKPCPFTALVDVMHQRKLPFTVQGFGNGAGHGRDRADSVVGKVGAVSRIYTDQGKSPPSGHKESVQPERSTLIR